MGRGGADVSLIASPFLWKFRGAVVRTPDSYARAQISVEPKLCFTFLSSSPFSFFLIQLLQHERHRKYVILFLFLKINFPLCQAHIIENGFSASVPMKELSKAGILLVVYNHRAHNL